MRRTHYDVLGVERDAASVDIASAFRDRLAQLKAKPGVAPEDVDAVRDAYQVLASPARRAEYDRSLMPFSPAPAAPPAANERDEPGAWRAHAIPAVVLAGIVAVAAWGYKASHKAPAARVISVTTVETAPARPETMPRKVERVANVTPAAAGFASAEQLFAGVSPSVVRVFASDAGGDVRAQGSGVVVEAGRVITNCHVVSGASAVTVKAGGDTHSASVGVADEAFDLCSLDVSGLQAPAVETGTVASLRTGQRVYAIGAPYGLELTISEGIVSSLRQVDEGTIIQTTAAVSPGSSGGGLFTADGKLVGIVSFQHREGQNLNFAVPVDWIRDMRTRERAS